MAGIQFLIPEVAECAELLVAFLLVGEGTRIDFSIDGYEAD